MSKTHGACFQCEQVRSLYAGMCLSCYREMDMLMKQDEIERQRWASENPVELFVQQVEAKEWLREIGVLK